MVMRLMMRMISIIVMMVVMLLLPMVMVMLLLPVVMVMCEDKEALAALVPAREDPRLSEWPEPFHNLTGDHPQYSHYHRYQP